MRFPCQAAARRLPVLLLAFTAAGLGACDSSPPSLPPAPADAGQADTGGRYPANAHTHASQALVHDTLPFADRQDFDDAARGLVARSDDTLIRSDDGERIVWNMSAYDFIEGEAPASVNPSLWRHATLNNQHGLYQVTDGVWQVRGYDLANMTLIAGDTGWIIVDPLTAAETARAAFALAQTELGERPIRAILFTHSHIDHFGGVLGITTAAAVEAEGIRVIAPAGFMEAATQENVIAGIAMGRRAQYMYGNRLSRDARGHVDSGLGKSPAFGSFGILEPTELVDASTGTLTIDGVAMEFQYAPESEAPAEFTFYLPAVRAYCGAELVSPLLHNLYTPRGAKVRDALRWARYIDEAIERFGPRTDVYFGSHMWPKWGNERIVAFLAGQHDTYKFIHDQTVRLFNAGLTPREIAETLTLPDALRGQFSNRGYYGTVYHNARAVFQNYLGWYDGNPAHLAPLPREETASRYIALMGGAATVIAAAREAHADGDDRWAAELLNRVLFAAPTNADARALLAQVYDQLGYRAESAPWRDIYLTGAFELRNGPPTDPTLTPAAMRSLLMHTPVQSFFEAMAVRLDGPAAAEVTMTVRIAFTDRDSAWDLKLRNGVLRYAPATGEADVELRLTHPFFISMMTGEAGLRDMLFSEELSVVGSRRTLLRFFSLLDTPEGRFNIATP